MGMHQGTCQSVHDPGVRIKWSQKKHYHKQPHAHMHVKAWLNLWSLPAPREDKATIHFHSKSR